MKRKKKGSSMLLTVAIFGILSIVGTSMLAVTTANYKIRIQENNRIKNLYSAESGIELAYVELLNCVEEAIKQGREEARKSENTILSESQKNKVFKLKYTESLKSQLAVDRRYSFSSGDATVSFDVDDDSISSDTGEGSLLITLNSYFRDSDSKERIVSVEYTVDIPDYVQTGIISDVNALNYSIATDGNLYINNVRGTNFNVYGDLWIRGRRSGDINFDPIINKYEGGAHLTQSDVIFNGSLITPANVTLNGSELEVKDSIFAENVLLGTASHNQDGDKAKLITRNIYLANDLVITSMNGVASIDNFYGFNDARTVVNGNEVRGSSSIIVNSENWVNNWSDTNIDGYKLKINDNAYIMGSAYLKLDDVIYQTGESVALKGNYMAYAYPFLGDIENTEYVYLDPYLFIDKNGEGVDLSVVDKAEHFKYINDNNIMEIKKSIISLPDNTYTIGAAVSGEEVIGSSYQVDIEETINSLKEEFVKQAYFMGEGGNGVAQFEKGEPDSEHIVNGKINWDNAGRNMDSYEDGLYYYFKTSDDIHVVVVDDADTEISIQEGIEYNALLIKNAKTNKAVSNWAFSKKDEQVIVIAKGKVNCNWLNNFNAVILAAGDVTIEGCNGSIGTEKKLTDIINESNQLKAVLGPLFDETISEDVIETTIDIKELVSKGKWTLVK